MQGEQVEIITYAQVGEDDFKTPIYVEKSIVVENVLVAPAYTGDLTGGQRIEGDKTRLELHFPKTFTTNLRGATAKIRGSLYKIIGDPQPYIPANTPTCWGRKAEAVRVDG
ncbi:hypothetical protein R6G85_02415 [Actinotignum urinale]|uniref:hypothetical protein n=1 Tax=Actinotignum urinale TaxID=190146 RepID=UPI000C800BC5|nr:hypothetical protein [Actinotignum urinale]MDY5151341.1 hypothetical protein [Actinotignum urinale]WIK58858.1 hypothetical protein CJ184_006325 [Actinotignum urinale]